MSKKYKTIKLIINKDTLRDYENYYFQVHPRAKRKPIPHPYHESINVWKRMKRPMMNALKQKWNDFIIWFINNQGYANLHIDKCEMVFSTFYPNNRLHDVDNSVPKFILDGLAESNFIVDDSNKHLTKLTLQCFSDVDNPRTEILVKILNDEQKEN